MIVVHLALIDHQLVAWGEAPPEPAPARVGDSDSATPRARTGKGRRAAETRVAPLPYDAGAKRLAEALTQAIPESSVSARAAEPFVAWLPTIAGRPVASSPLVADPTP